MTDQQEIDLTSRIAEFVVEALELEDTPESLHDEIEAFQRESNAGISTIELQSSAGVMAFLVYHYLIDASDENGQTGADRFDNDLKVIERATKLDTPGPRILAHAMRDGQAYILATSPATHRVLTGAPEPADEFSPCRARQRKQRICAVMPPPGLSTPFDRPTALLRPGSLPFAWTSPTMAKLIRPPESNSTQKKPNWRCSCSTSQTSANFSR